MMAAKSRNQKTQSKTLRRGLSLYKTNASPYWYVRIWVSGERRYFVKSTKETSRLTAEEVAEELLNDVKQKRFVDGVPPKRTFRYFAEKLTENQTRMAGKDRHRNFAKSDGFLLNRKKDGIIAHFGRRDIGSIRTSDIRDYLNTLDDQRDVPLANSSKNKHVIIIRKVLKTAYDHGVIDAIPPTPQIPRQDNPRPSFTEVEYKLLLKTARDVAKEGIKVRGILITRELYYFILFMTHTFLRPTESEVFALKHEDVVQKDEPLRLEIVVAGKTGHRTVSTTNDAPAFYKHLQKLHPEYKADDYVFFPEYLNRSTAKRNINRQFNFVLERAGLKKTKDGRVRSPYALRHYSLQTRILKSKGLVNIYTLAKVAGTSVDQLERFYLKHLPIDERMAENLQSMG
jgi:integrase